jgi:phenylacetate-CoA ligase
MTQPYDSRETRDPRQRELIDGHLPGLVANALKATGWRRHLGDVNPADVLTRADLARLPVLRKSALPPLQKSAPPCGGLIADPIERFGRLVTSPGPIYEPEGRHDDAWRAARGLHAAGFRAGDVVLNTFSYHLTPGGFILDGGARALCCSVIPAGQNTEQQLDQIEQYRPGAYTGTPDFLKILLDAAQAGRRDATSIRKAAVSGAAFPPSLQAEIRSRGIDAYQLYAAADLGVVAYETPARAGMVVNEDVLVEIVRPGTGDTVPDGGRRRRHFLRSPSSVDTAQSRRRPAILPGVAVGELIISACWMGRADQTAGQDVGPSGTDRGDRPRHAGVGRMRLIVSRRRNRFHDAQGGVFVA